MKRHLLEAADLDLALAVMAGPEDAHSVGWRLARPPPRAEALAGYRIAAWLDDPYCPIDAEILARYERLVADLRAAGARVDYAAPRAPLAAGPGYHPVPAPDGTGRARRAAARRTWTALAPPGPSPQACPVFHPCRTGP